MWFKRKLKGEVGHIYGVKLMPDIKRLEDHLATAKDGDYAPDWALDDLEYMNEQLNGKYDGQLRGYYSAQAILKDYREKFGL